MTTLNAPLSGRWMARSRTAGDPRLRLICFPHVGGGGAAFHSWLDALPAGVELCAIRLPGRENRLHEPLLDDPAELFAHLEPVLAPLCDLPFVLVGHCSGSVLAYEYARRRHAAGGPQPAMVVLSSTEAPRHRRIDAPLHLLPRDELLGRVVGYGGMAAEVLDDAGLMAIFEQILRADYRAVERLSYSAGPPLDAPITVIAGRHDRFTSRAAMAAWSEETTGEFSLHLLDAGHYLVREAGPRMADVARALLDRQAAR
ncbi:alpha/beta fold hydrolase [Micromonospora sp. CPCC 205371]|nr:alpha/beta fold hydrolase [Micromonospora sp. CPCC 205371]